MKLISYLCEKVRYGPRGSMSTAQLSDYRSSTAGHTHGSYTDCAPGMMLTVTRKGMSSAVTSPAFRPVIGDIVSHHSVKSSGREQPSLPVNQLNKCITTNFVFCERYPVLSYAGCALASFWKG